MKLRMIVLKKSSIRRSLALSIMMILVGITLINPFVAKATPTDYVTKTSPKLYYLYPMPQNNGMFWLESNPSLGYGTLQEWNKKLGKGNMIVATPSNMQLASMGGLDRIGKYVQNKIKGRTENGRYDKDIFKYRRTVTAEGVTDEIEVEIGKHFKDNDNLEKLISKVKNHLTTDAGQTQEIKDPVFPPIVQPENKPDTEETKNAKTQIVGGSMLIGGLMLFAKVLVFAL